MVLYFKPSGTRWLEDLNYFKLLGRKYGLEPIQTLDVSKQDPPRRKVASATWSFANELLLVYYKLDENERYWFHGDTNIDKLIYECAMEITESEGGFSLTRFYNRLHKILVEKGLLAIETNELKIRETLKRYTVLEGGKFSINQNLIPPFTELVRHIDVEQRIFDYTPEVVEFLLNESPVGFTYPDFLLKLSLYLDNGEKEVIKILENNADRRIRTNLLNFVEEQEGFLVRKPELDISNFAGEETRTDLHSLAGEEFEYLIKILLEENGFSNVYITARTGDRGVDVVANKNGEKYVIQCKRWKMPVNATPIQRIDSFRKSRNADHAWVIATSYYTHDAKSEARITGTRIIDGEEIRKQLEKSFPGEFY